VGEQHEQLLHRAYEAFNARDIRGALATMRIRGEWRDVLVVELLLGSAAAT
jgi:hypothetical protein